MKNNFYQDRKIEIEIFKKVGVDKETYLTLKHQKKKQKKSMARIVKNLVMEKYNETIKKQV